MKLLYGVMFTGVYSVYALHNFRKGVNCGLRTQIYLLYNLCTYNLSLSHHTVCTFPIHTPCIVTYTYKNKNNVRVIYTHEHTVIAQFRCYMIVRAQTAPGTYIELSTCDFTIRTPFRIYAMHSYIRTQHK